MKKTTNCKTSGNKAIPKVATILLFAYCASMSNPALAANFEGTVWEKSAREIAPELLYAIALQESRELYGDKVRPRPWVIRHGDKVHEAETYWEAVDRLQALLESGANPKAIDVGLMQVNLGWHGHRVEQPMELLIPALNISVAEEILTEARGSSSDTVIGVGRYHSYTSELAQKYGKRVVGIACRLGHRFSQREEPGVCHERDTDR